MKHRLINASLAIGLAVLGTGCKKEPPPPTPAKAAAETPPPTNRVDINASVRQNLGITFGKVESRAVNRTLRLPGRFELLPTALLDYRAMASGRVELLVQQYQAVRQGDLLFRLDSPRVRELQQELAQAEAGIEQAKASSNSIAPLLKAHEAHHHEIEKAIELWTKRLTQLEELRAAGGGRADEITTVTASLTQSRADLAEAMETEAELLAKRSEVTAQLAAATKRFDILLASMASFTGLDAKTLATTDDKKTPRWQSIASVEVRSTVSGVVEQLGVTNGGWAEVGQQVLTVINPEQVRFRAKALQNDLGRLTEGMTARIVPPAGSATASWPTIDGKLNLAPHGDADRRTIDLLITPTAKTAAWGRSGVSGFVEVVWDGSKSADLAIPVSCVVRDGLKPIIFRRDPANADKVIRMEADLGIDDGRWVVINSGVAEGNEIVLDGAYQLLVATSGSIQKGGHFHPDGTFHEGED